MRTKRWHVLETLVKERGCRIGAELGVLTGATFFHLLDHTDIAMVGVDRWQNDTGDPQAEQYDMPALFEATSERAAAYGERATLIRGDTTWAAGKFSDGAFDFVFIDADHSKNAVLADIRAWAPKVRTGGFVAGHDIDWAGVREAVDELTICYRVLPDDVWLADKHDVKVGWWQT